MAYRVTIKVTKSDTKPWYWLSPDIGPDTVQRLAQSKDLGLDFVNDFTYEDSHAVFTKDFDDKISANKFLLNLMLLPPFPGCHEEQKAVHPGEWKEEISIQEI